MRRMGRWLATSGRRGWQIGGLAVGVFVVWTLLDLLLLLVMTVAVALLLAALLTPPARWLERLGPPRTVATLLTFVLLVVVVVGLGALLGVRVADRIPELTQQVGDVRASLRSYLQQSPLDISAEQVDRPFQQATSYLRGHGGQIASRALGLLGFLGALLTAVIAAFFMVRDGDQITGWLLEHAVDEDQRDRVARAGRSAGATLRGYIQAVVVIGGLDALLIGIALLVLGVPLAIPLAVLTFIGGFFPVVGATVAGFLAALVALATGGLVDALIVVAVVVVIQQIDGNLLQPVIMGRAVELHPLVILLALTAGGVLAGIVGAFLFVPATAVLVAAVRELVAFDGDGAQAA